MAEPFVKVTTTGVRELVVALKKVDGQLPKELRTQFLGIAKKVRDVTVQRMPWVTGRAARSVSAGATQTGAYVQEGVGNSPQTDYIPWLDFGGSTGRGHHERMPWSGAIKRDWMGKPNGSGRYLFPAVSSERAATAEAVAIAVRKVANDAGLSTSEEIL